MASATATQHIRANHLIEFWDHDPGTTAATVTTPDGGTTSRYVDMRDHNYFGAVVIQTVLGGTGVTKLEIVAATDTAGTGLVVIKDSGALTLTALSNWAIQECTAAEIAQAASTAGVDLRYAAARITQQNSGDEAIVGHFTYPLRPHLDLTPASTIQS